MKLLKTYADSAHDGYLDPLTRCHYFIRDSVVSPHAPRQWTVRVSEGEYLYRISPPFATEAEALAELDRIAASIEGPAPAPAQEWVKGPPPCRPGWWLIIDYHNNPAAVQWVPKNIHGQWICGNEDTYTDIAIRYHLPTPIQLPKES